MRLQHGTLSVTRNYFSGGKLLSNFFASQLFHLQATHKKQSLVNHLHVNKVHTSLTYFHVEHLKTRLSPAAINSLGINYPLAKNWVSLRTGMTLPMMPVTPPYILFFKSVTIDSLASNQ